MSSLPVEALSPTKSASIRSNSSGELDIVKPHDKAALKHISQSSLEVDESVIRAEGEERTTAFVWWLVIAAATGGLLFGYDVSLRAGDEGLLGSHARSDDLMCTDRCHRRSPRPQGHQSGSPPLPAQLWQQRGASSMITSPARPSTNTSGPSQLLTSATTLGALLAGFSSGILVRFSTLKAVLPAH